MGPLGLLRLGRGRRLAVGLVVSLVLHGGLVALAFVLRPVDQRHTPRRGDTIMVELPKPEEPPAPGVRGAPPGPPAAPAPRPAPPVAEAPKPTPPAPRVTAPPAPPPRREPEPPRERQVARAPEPAPRAAPPPRVPEPAPQAAEPAPRAAAPRAPEASAPARPAERAPAAEPPREGAGPQVAALPPQGQAPGPDVKSLLRRGGGGAGGQAEGRGAVEGEPVPLDSRDPKYSDYLEQVRRKIKANWGYPCVKNDLTRGCDYKTTSLVIEFGIAKDGRVPFVTVLRSSGYPIYDDYAVNAVKLSSPFPPLPDAFGRRGIPIHATFSYVVEASLTNLLR